MITSRTRVIDDMVENEGMTVAEIASIIHKPSACLYDIRSGKINGVSEKLANLILSKFPHYSKSWLMTGEGDMLVPTMQPTEGNDGIPMIPVNAMAGAFTSEVLVQENECERFIIQPFKGADFLIRVSGNSMEPTYRQNDIVACRRVPMTDLFFQWGECYVIDTDQGVLLKRLRRNKDNNLVTVVSDNRDYDSFELPKSHIYHAALIIGLLRLS